MSGSQKRPRFGVLVYFCLAFLLGIYFTFAAVQGDYGLFRRIQAEAQIRTLEVERDHLQAQLAVMSNKTRRLSDDFLDLDLLDQQAREVLGLLRADEIVIR
ncbi:septum formation initiator precursor [Actibacterium mucosum KCTC 23349]|uniref:Septum formation initiator n=1 Tax=Actibacterium mucosum KCTC 23349 TaxID=1454373 RepID=A0A037ZLS2_9RHOB|nr:septum formation initiator family protein [Actibacterium mucosum]KAJ56594.1 septum formation initiator precursor [Actibacterium mucosum KCTC 23349]